VRMARTATAARSSTSSMAGFSSACSSVGIPALSCTPFRQLTLIRHAVHAPLLKARLEAGPAVLSVTPERAGLAHLEAEREVDHIDAKRLAETK
jgi:hypothetical protein